MSENKTSILKKAVTVGVGAAMLTEEGLRGLFQELKLPKELMGQLLQMAQQSKTEFFQKLSGEILTQLQKKMDPQALLQEILKNNELEFEIKLKFNPRNKSKTD